MQLSVINMAPIQTFVYIDFATEYQGEAVTEVSLLATPRNLILDPKALEPSDKLTLNFKSGGAFNLASYNEINQFINRQQKPVCLVAHNGNTFDFPILKRELRQLDVTLADDLLCADSLFAFYDILEHPDNYYGNAVRTIFFVGKTKPAISYELGEIYKREVGFPPVKPHPPENDNIMNFRISRKLGARFLTWTDRIQRQFADVRLEE